MSTVITLRACGETIRIESASNGWISPCDGQFHPTPSGAYRAEISAMVAASGDDLDDESVQDTIDCWVEEALSQHYAAE